MRLKHNSDVRTYALLLMIILMAALSGSTPALSATACRTDLNGTVHSDDFVYIHLSFGALGDSYNGGSTSQTITLTPTTATVTIRANGFYEEHTPRDVEGEIWSIEATGTVPRSANNLRVCQESRDSYSLNCLVLSGIPTIETRTRYSSYAPSSTRITKKDGGLVFGTMTATGSGVGKGSIDAPRLMGSAVLSPEENPLSDSRRRTTVSWDLVGKPTGEPSLTVAYPTDFRLVSTRGPGPIPVAGIDWPSGEWLPEGYYYAPFTWFLRYEWKSSTGNLKDLANVKFREILIFNAPYLKLPMVALPNNYPITYLRGRSVQSPWKSPPGFEAGNFSNPRDSHILVTWSGLAGSGSDAHEPTLASIDAFNASVVNSSYTIEQHYEWTSKELNQWVSQHKQNGMNPLPYASVDPKTGEYWLPVVGPGAVNFITRVITAKPVLTIPSAPSWLPEAPWLADYSIAKHGIVTKPSGLGLFRL